MGLIDTISTGFDRKRLGRGLVGINFKLAVITNNGLIFFIANIGLANSFR